MKTPKQIENWLKSQPYYETLETNVMRATFLNEDSIRILLSGSRGEKTMRDAVLFLDPDIYDWDKIERDFAEWYNEETK